MRKFTFAIIFLLIIFIPKYAYADNDHMSVNEEYLEFQKNVYDYSRTYTLYSFKESIYALNEYKWGIYEINEYSKLQNFLDNPHFSTLNNLCEQYGVIKTQGESLFYTSFLGKFNFSRNYYYCDIFLYDQPFYEFMEYENLKNILSQNNISDNILNYSAISLANGKYFVIWIETDKETYFLINDKIDYHYIILFDPTPYDTLSSYKICDINYMRENFMASYTDCIVEKNSSNMLQEVINIIVQSFSTIDTFKNMSVNKEYLEFQKNVYDYSGTFSLYSFKKSIYALNEYKWGIYEINEYSKLQNFLDNPHFSALNNLCRQYGIIKTPKENLFYESFLGKFSLSRDHYYGDIFLYYQQFYEFMKYENLKNILSQNDISDNILNYSAISLANGEYLVIWIETDKETYFLINDIINCHYHISFDSTPYDTLSSYKICDINYLRENFMASDTDCIIKKTL